MEYVEKTGENNGTKKTSDEEERDFYYPNGDILTHEKHTDVLHVNMSKVPEIWQHTSAGRRDIFYTVSVIIENYLLRCSCSRDMLDTYFKQNSNFSNGQKCSLSRHCHQER